ncbi:hypothetical protein [Allochromatium tepidum]|uniref:Uncharacterized protein n=1 Tax=Allochromatium tepidum TaxID=553982 RepID=A0ABN6G9L8_9GAMM|nr:hypothetical protein [Allochromatium tepidum]BCU06358.1 hypothetical protein Atep_10350 [Allochromatium tepidum]
MGRHQDLLVRVDQHIEQEFDQFRVDAVFDLIEQQKLMIGQGPPNFP